MVQGSKVLKVELSNYGSYLGRADGCFEIRDKTGKVERYPHFQKEIAKLSSRAVHTSALTL